MVVLRGLTRATQEREQFESASCPAHELLCFGSSQSPYKSHSRVQKPTLSFNSPLAPLCKARPTLATETFLYTVLRKPAQVIVTERRGPALNAFGPPVGVLSSCALWLRESKETVRCIDSSDFELLTVSVELQNQRARIP